MDFRLYKEVVRAIPGGKQLPDAVYLHDTAIDLIPPELLADMAKAVAALGLEGKEWNVVKFFKRDHKVTLLNYPRFFEDPYPALEHASWFRGRKCHTVGVIPKQPLRRLRLPPHIASVLILHVVC